MFQLKLKLNHHFSTEKRAIIEHPYSLEYAVLFHLDNMENIFLMLKNVIEYYFIVDMLLQYSW